MTLFNEYLTLLAKRESNEVLGKRWVNLWMLIAVLTATFMSIAFSRGSLDYLDEKMNDPFTNWVNIENEHKGGKFSEVPEALASEDVQAHYGFSNVQTDYFGAIPMFKQDMDSQILYCRFFERLDNDLTRDIVDSVKNAWNDYTIGYNRLSQGDGVGQLGFIITEEALFDKLGYSRDSVPTYISYKAPFLGEDTLGVETFSGKGTDQKYTECPVPVLAVVKHLPLNMDVIAHELWLKQFWTDKVPFNMNREYYQEQLNYFVVSDVAASIEDFESQLHKLIPQESKLHVVEDDYNNMMVPWRDGMMVSIDLGGDRSVSERMAVAKKIAELYDRNDVARAYKFDIDENYQLEEKAYISVNFASLDSIRPFEKFVKSDFGVQVEMSQVNSKENFNAVTIMAYILSMAMVIFSIVCIILFIVNMMQSYFQKVKRNLGTFKAFGMSSRELIRVYVSILSAIVVCAITSALVVSAIFQILLPMIGIERENGFNYLNLVSVETMSAVIIILVASVATVYVVMQRMLKQTPGDLIYDR